MELYPNVCEKTVENFISLCKGEQNGENLEQRLLFKRKDFHNLIKLFDTQDKVLELERCSADELIEGVGFTKKKFGDSRFKKGDLFFAYAGKNTVGSQFFMTFTEC